MTRERASDTAHCDGAQTRCCARPGTAAGGASDTAVSAPVLAHALSRVARVKSAQFGCRFRLESCALAMS